MVQQCMSPKPPRWRPFHRFGKLRRKGSAPNPSTLSSNRTCSASNDGGSLPEQSSTEATFIDKQVDNKKSPTLKEIANNDKNRIIEAEEEQVTPSPTESLPVVKHPSLDKHAVWVQHGQAVTMPALSGEDYSLGKANSEFRDPPIGMDDESSLIPKLQSVAEPLKKSKGVIAGAEVEIDSIANYVDADVLASPYNFTMPEDGNGQESKKEEEEEVAIPSEVVCRRVNSMDGLSLNSEDFDAPSFKVELPPSMRKRANAALKSNSSPCGSLEDAFQPPNNEKAEKPKAHRLAHRISKKWSKRYDSERSQVKEEDEQELQGRDDEVLDDSEHKCAELAVVAEPEDSNNKVEPLESESMLQICQINIDSPSTTQPNQPDEQTPYVKVTNDGTEINCATGKLQVHKNGEMVQIQVTDATSPSGTKHIELPLKMLETVEASLRHKVSASKLLRVDSMSSIFSDETQIAKTARTFTEECPVFVDLLLNFNQCMTSFGQALHMCKDDLVDDEFPEDLSVGGERNVNDEDLVMRSFDADETIALKTVDDEHVNLLRSYSDALAEIAHSVKVMAEAEAVHS